MMKPGSSYNDPNHHRSSAQTHKPFKGRHGHKSKSAIKTASKGKVERETVYKPKNHVPSKIERRNTQKQIQKNKKEEQVRNARFFGGARGAAKIVAVVSLCPDVDVHRAIVELNASVDAETPSFEGSMWTTEITRFKQSLQYLVPPTSSTTDVLDTCLPADFILLLLSSTVEVPESSLNTLRSILSQGTPSIIPIVANLTFHSNPKTRAEVKKSLLTYIQQYIPTAERVFAADDRGEASTVMRMVCAGVPVGIRWREQRSYLLPEGWRWDEDEDKVVFWGTIRGKPLQVDRLIHLPSYGDFQIDKIYSLPDVTTNKIKTSMDVDRDASSMDPNPTSTILATPTADQDSLSPLAEEDTEMAEDTKSLLSHRSQSKKGVRIDDHYYFEDDEPQLAKKKNTKGLSDYQLAWQVSDSDQSADEEGGENEVEMEDAYENDSEVSYHEEDTSELADTASEMHVDLSPEEEAKQHELFKARETDAHFPDEVEFPPTIPARTRFARYRALKNFRTSPWDIDEPDDDRAPTEWSRLVRFSNWRGTCSRVDNESLSGGIKPGVRVQVYLRGCPKEVLSRPPRAVFSLFKHENKVTTLNFTITPVPPDEDQEVPVVKSKDILVVQYACRRYECRPIFSQPLAPSTENNVRKFERYLQPGRTSVASWLGNTVVGKDVPILFFQKTADGGLRLIATGSSLAPTPPIIVKRATLTGHPYRVHKKVVTMRYMFFNREDVSYYKPVQLVSKQGRRGWIKEPLGTHGYFKASFDGKIDKQDTVGLSLYKRIWPRLGV